MDNIISYREYIWDSQICAIDEKGSTIEKPFGKSFENIYGYICPLCGKKLDDVYYRYDSMGAKTKVEYKIEINQCKNCGWWNAKNELNDNNTYLLNSIYLSVAQKYNLSKDTLPLDVLNDELNRNKNLLNQIKPHKLEQIVKDIFSDFYECNVFHVGGKNDNGIDLLVVESDSPILVQVKRRENPQKNELVKGIREFVGAMYLNGGKKGIYVTTAKNFSQGSIDMQKNIIHNRKLRL